VAMVLLERPRSGSSAFAQEFDAYSLAGARNHCERSIVQGRVKRAAGSRES
jgi:hypothetical protein